MVVSDGLSAVERGCLLLSKVLMALDNSLHQIPLLPLAWARFWRYMLPFCSQ